MRLEEKISRAKAKLLVDYPYFGALAGRLEFAQNDDAESFLSDGTRFEYNDDYLRGLELDELGFALANGAMHAALQHENRRKGRMGWLWQLATDYAINAMLTDNGLEPPEGINHDERFEGMYAEEIYAILKDEIKNEEFDDNEENETGLNESNRRHQQQMRNAEGDHDPQKRRPQMEVENVAQEAQWEQIAEEAMKKTKKIGNLPLGLERFFDVDVEAKIDWRRELHDALDVHAKSDYRQLPPARKLLYMGTYLPSLHSDMLRLVIAIDSSGSVDETLLGSFIAEIESLLLHFSSYAIELLVADAAVQSHRSFGGGDVLEVGLKGGGGTDFRPVFDYVDLNLPHTQLLLYFTDTQGKFPEEAPLYEVVWVVPQEAEVPFGRVLVIGGEA
jgi:predicted metal-dependent peptidase